MEKIRSPFHVPREQASTPTRCAAKVCTEVHRGARCEDSALSPLSASERGLLRYVCARALPSAAAPRTPLRLHPRSSGLGREPGARPAAPAALHAERAQSRGCQGSVARERSALLSTSPLPLKPALNLRREGRLSDEASWLSGEPNAHVGHEHALCLSQGNTRVST